MALDEAESRRERQAIAADLQAVRRVRAPVVRLTPELHLERPRAHQLRTLSAVFDR